MCKPNVTVQTHPHCPGAAATGGSIDNGCAVFAPPGRGMSHNVRTPQGVGPWPASIPREGQLTQQNGGPGVRCETVDPVACIRTNLAHSMVGSGRTAFRASGFASPEGPRTNGE